MRFRTAILTLLLLASSPFAARADAGGDDAPDDWSAALDVHPGPLSGTLGEGDAADWYRVALPPGWGARVHLYVPSAPAGHALVLLNDQGWHVASARLGWTNLTLEGFAHGAMRVGVLQSAKENATTNGTSNDTGLVDYYLRVELFTAPDFAVEDLRVTNRALRTDLMDVPPGHLRTIHVDVANLGGAGHGWLAVYAETPSDGRLTPIVETSLWLGEGDARSLSFDWDATGIVGDVTVRAWIHAWGDADFPNGYAETRHYVLVGGAGVGYAPAAPSGTCAPLVAGYACAGASAEHGRVQAAAYHVGPFHHGFAHASTGGHDAALSAGLFTPRQGASAGVYRDLPHGSGFAYGCLYGDSGGRCFGQPLP